jgi:hypothetical protein
MGVVQASPHGLMNSAVPFPEWVDNIVLAGGLDTDYTAPAASGFCVLTSSAPIYAKIGGAATIPVASAVDGTGSFYVAAGMQFKVGSGKVISMISATSTEAVITIGVYRA